jgi:hypothetical protein
MASLRSLFFFALGALYLLFLWSRNYNLLGDTYDYSIVISACAHLRAGLTPYRDFTTPLQSLTIYLCAAAEWIFGRRYLALACGNLALGLGFYIAILACLNARLPRLLQILAAVAICGATFFQHGILWYNPVAMLLITLIVWCAALWYREGGIQPRYMAALCILLYLSSMCKLNFHILGLAIVISILFLLFLKSPKADRRLLIWILPALVFAGTVPGPVTELLLNHATPREFMENVLLTPRGRVNYLGFFLGPTLYFGTLSNFYPDNPISGIYWKGVLIYGACILWVSQKSRAPAEETRPERGNFSLNREFPVLLAGFLAGSMLLSVSNVETEILTAVFLVVGLLTAHLMFAPLMSAAQTRGLEFCITILCGLFCLYGGFSAILHSRVRYVDASWTVNVLRAMQRESPMDAMKLRFPFYPAAEVNPRLKSYFGGVRFTETTRDRMVRITAFMDKHRLNDQPGKVFWGPGLEIMNAVYNDPPRVRLPLWFHMNVTVRDGDSPRLIGAFKQADYEWLVIAVRWLPEMPTGVKDYFEENYEGQADGDLLVFHKKPTAPGTAPH